MKWNKGNGVKGDKEGRIVKNEDEFERIMKELKREKWMKEVGEVMKGYIGNKEKEEEVESMVKEVKEKNKEEVYIWDKVIGEEKGIYVKEENEMGIRERIMKIEDIEKKNSLEI